jgi:ketosteroid isomerase-like protein
MPSDAHYLDLMQRFADAWNRRDVSALMSCMTDACVFVAPAGQGPTGSRYEGPAQVRNAFAQIFERYPHAEWRNARHYVFGDRGFSEWRFVGTTGTNERVDCLGCDLFRFRDGYIHEKNSFRKY